MGHNHTSGQEGDNSRVLSNFRDNVAEIAKAKDHHRLHHWIFTENSELLQDVRAEQTEDQPNE